jgi:hypothetical protein
MEYQGLQTNRKNPFSSRKEKKIVKDFKNCYWHRKKNEPTNSFTVAIKKILTYILDYMMK